MSQQKPFSPSTHPFVFSLEATDGDARAGYFSTPHGLIPTPLFAPVGTQATVKSLTPAHLVDLDARLILANTYHLYLRPGSSLVSEMGGLHTFMAWDRPILTDSGGFQVFSLAKTRRITEEGVQFKSHIDGSTHQITPERSIEIQEDLGADIIMAFDECAEPHDREYNEHALLRTHAWAERCQRHKKRPDQALFGIVQGGVFPDLRQSSAEFLTAMDLPGYAIGGLSVGESKTEMYDTITTVNKILPGNKPRYLMGVGTPEDLIHGIMRGVDIFDCVLPTRLARHQAAMTLSGRKNLMNAVYSHDQDPIDPQCGCYTCRHFSQAYLRHLIIAKEMLAATLLSIHNIHTLLELTRACRLAIVEGRFAHYAETILANLSQPSVEMKTR
ncbi:MAG: tRNA guanosine(34) transglycosylase Tgt [Anaerolineae bacterium]|nr:tRNA guanosine(34) transglycosylase Tgt [Anaerolineae bacterium]